MKPERSRTHVEAGASETQNVKVSKLAITDESRVLVLEGRLIDQPGWGTMDAMRVCSTVPEYGNQLLS